LTPWGWPSTLPTIC